MVIQYLPCAQLRVNYSPSDTADVIHEKFRELLVVDRVVDTEWSNLHPIELVGRVVSAAAKDAGDCNEKH